MKVLVVGSKRFITPDQYDLDQSKRLKDEIDKASLELGKCLAEHGHTILVGADDPADIDPSIVAGALANSNRQASIEVHVPHGMSVPYSGQHADSNVELKIRWHQFPDWDVTSMEVVRNVDGVVAIGGRTGVIQAGISAWMMGIPIIPVGYFGGGAKVLWEYGSSRRAEFYHEGIDDADIDRLASPWREGTADFVVDALERVSKAKNLARTPRKLLFFELALMVVSLVGWIFFLTFPSILGSTFSGGKELSLAWIFVTVSAAGLLGASMQTLRSIRGGGVVTWRRIVIDTALGITAGVVSAMLYLLAQVGMNGKVTVTMDEGDYIRVALITSMVALFAALYLDSAFARFDKFKETVITGKFKEPESS